MQAGLENKLNDLSSLAILLHQAIVNERAKIDAIPESATVEDEMNAIIDAVDVPWRIAEHMLDLTAKNAMDIEAKARAETYIDGKYWSKYSQ